MRPSWVQVEAKLASKSDPQRHGFSKLVLDWKSEHLGLDFEYFLGSKMEPKSELKTRGAKFVKFDSRIHGSSIFKVPGWSEIDEKLMQTRPQTKTAPQEPKEARKSCQDSPKIGPSWGPSGS